MNKLLNTFEQKCIKLGEIQTVQQMIRFPVYLQNGRALLGEINILIKEIAEIKAELQSYLDEGVLSEEDFIGAQEESIRAQFGDDFGLDELDKNEFEQMMNEPNLFCESCGQVLYDENTIKIDNGSLPIYVCTDCATGEEKNNG